jgi:hypothetical protein
VLLKNTPIETNPQVLNIQLIVEDLSILEIQNFEELNKKKENYLKFEEKQELKIKKNFVCLKKDKKIKQRYFDRKNNQQLNKNRTTRYFKKS